MGRGYPDLTGYVTATQPHKKNAHLNQMFSVMCPAGHMAFVMSDKHQCLIRVEMLSQISGHLPLMVFVQKLERLIQQ